jgi:hypothetical protein
MIWTSGSRSTHLEDGDLLGYEDHALDRAAHRRAEAHLLACAECAARLEGLRAGAVLVRDALATLDVPVPAGRREAARAAVQSARFRPRSNRGALWAAAASIALMLTVAFGTPPGRAWVGSAAEWLGAVPATRPDADVDASAPVEPPAVTSAPLEEAAQPAVASPPVRRGTDATPGTSVVVRFDPSGNSVLLRFESRQRTGSAYIWVRDASEGSAQVVANRRSEALLPTVDGLLVRNERGSRADYNVVVPTSYRYLRVRIGDEPETVIPIARSSREWLWTLNLSE